MGYNLKVTGITEAKKTIEDIKSEIKALITKAEGKRFKLEIPTLPGLIFDFKADALEQFIKELPALLKRVHVKTMREIGEMVETALNEAMDSSVWDWGSDNRDIVDTGKLRDSLTLYVDSDGDIHIMYGEEYAAIVHYGGYFNPYGNPNVTRYYPGRPWVDSVLQGGGPVEQFDLIMHYRDIFTKHLSSELG